MGCWSCPDTKEKAAQLKQLMEHPLLKKAASHQLFHLMGDDDLYDLIDREDDNCDIRIYVAFMLENWLERLDDFVKPWSLEAIDICQSVVKNTLSIRVLQKNYYK